MAFSSISSLGYLYLSVVVVPENIPMYVMYVKFIVVGYGIISIICSFYFMQQLKEESKDWETIGPEDDESY